MEWFTSVTLLTALVPLTVVTLDLIRRILQDRTERKDYHFPPGPTPLPLFGNVLSVNAQRPWITYTEWRAEYGDIIYIRLLNNNVIVLNSTSVAAELLGKRSQIYSDRPFIPTIVPYGHDCNFGTAPYGEHWRLCRRIFQQTFRAASAVTFRPMQLRRARELIVNMIDDHDRYPFHFSTFSAGVAVSAVYDYEPSPRNDPIVSIVDNYLQAAIRGLSPEKIVLLSAFPFLLHIPGSWIRREAKEAYAWRNKMIGTPYQYVQERMKSKDYTNVSMVSDHLTRMEKLDDTYRSEYEMALKHASVTSFIGSAETTTSTLMTFTLAMVQNPHVWKRAQAAIDAVVGTDRLPEFDDRASLPYVDAIMRETSRWRPVLPIGFPHAVMRSDTYEGYYIPKDVSSMYELSGRSSEYLTRGNHPCKCMVRSPGTRVRLSKGIYYSCRAMSRDEARYPDGDKFIPERFLDESGMLTDDDPSEFVFGFGRRRCPGRYTADASVWSAVATMLATLDFNLAKDADGNNITFEATFTNGMTDHPNPFPCLLSPRPHVSKKMLGRV